MEEKGRGGAEGSLLLPADLATPPPPKPSSSRPQTVLSWPAAQAPGPAAPAQQLPQEGIHPKPAWPRACVVLLQESKSSLPIHSGGPSTWRAGLELSPFTHGYDSTSSQASRCPPLHHWPNHPCPLLFLTAAVWGFGKQPPL